MTCPVSRRSRALSCASSLMALALLSSLPGLGRAAESEANDLATRYWVSRTQLSPAESAGVPAWCDGAWRLPPLAASADAGADADRVLAYADAVDYRVAGKVELIGDVHITQGTRQLRAQQGEFERGAGKGTLSGEVQLRDASLLLLGTSAQIDLNSNAASAQQTEFLLLASGLRGEAEQISHSAEGDVRLQRSRFTRCEPGSRLWRVDAGSLEVSEDAVFGTARNSVLRVAGVPVFYMPYIKFPISDARQSGFLFPHLGLSARHGLELAFPYYLNLAPNRDLTLAPRRYGDRGTGVEAEMRLLSGWGRVGVSGRFLPSDDRYDGRYDRNDWQARQLAGLISPDAEFDPADRWFVGLNHRGRWGRLQTRVDYALQSDRDYLRDLGQNQSSRGDVSLTRLAEIRYAWRNLTVRLWAQGFQRLDNLRQPAYERVPGLDLTWQAALPGGLRVSLAVEGGSFDRSPGGYQGVQALTGERGHLEPRVSLPLRWPYGHLTATAGYRYTAYRLDSEAGPLEDASPERSLPVLSLDGGLIFDRQVNGLGGRWRQTLEPRIFYLYQGYAAQDGLPLFDATDLRFGYEQLFRDNRFSGLDRIADANQLSLALDTRLFDRGTGREVFSASIGQIRYFRDRRVRLAGNLLDQAPAKHGSAIAARVSGRIHRAWRLRGELIWNPHASEVEQGAAHLAWRPGDGRLLTLIYRNHLIAEVDQIDASFYWNLSRKFAIFGRIGQDLTRNRGIERLGGIEYNDCCWQVRLMARRYLDQSAVLSLEPVDRRSGIYLQLVFKGLAGLGGEADAILRRSIRGFEPSAAASDWSWQ